ncbi:hypothetical protein [Lacihabitans soyangensis]|jgi:hypothetical protein|uniref:Uncharacterized protein n=1 Tax=Lacihabitans soyangensis TaxID=869394 RepID=A0AAE3H600_9BACT|nr:hypothetical protein [Lacihabitans soyangensis]MCP9765523.1 hypothetical protein [Lacihabitans soyangensis]
MRTVAEMNAKILKLSQMIEADYPEISMYLTEMPVTIPNVSSPKINASTLSEYYESLKILLKDYIENKKKLRI